MSLTPHAPLSLKRDSPRLDRGVHLPPFASPPRSKLDPTVKPWGGERTEANPP